MQEAEPPRAAQIQFLFTVTKDNEVPLTPNMENSFSSLTWLLTLLFNLEECKKTPFKIFKPKSKST